MNEWYYLKEKEKIGPISTDTVNELINSYEIEKSTKLWKKGFKAWVTITEIEEFKDKFLIKTKISNQKEKKQQDDMPPDNPLNSGTDSENNYAMWMYICSISCCCAGIPGIVMWLIKRGGSKIIDRHGLNIMNLFLTILIVSIPIITSIPALIYGWVVLIMAGVKAKNGVFWKIPAIPIIKIKD